MLHGAEHEQNPRRIDAALKAKIALEALREDATVAELTASEDLVRAGLQLRPTHPHLLGEFAKLAQLRGDWAEASGGGKRLGVRCLGPLSLSLAVRVR